MQKSIILSDISVCYRVQDERPGGLKEYAIRFFQGRIHYRDFWALKGIDLSIFPGECFGIIGPNGAGKSTLLKVISRVLPPSKGRVITKGEISPLLELGAGFHPELTGRENIFLNGTLLGHSRSDIKAHMDEILSFADIDGFIDSPIRTFSSGMVTRLGFSVATAWQPEILLLDETLSVGDQEFRMKCSERIRDYSTKGTTILISTHDIGSLQSLCTRTLWLDHGLNRMLGPTQEVTQVYSAQVL